MQLTRTVDPCPSIALVALVAAVGLASPRAHASDPLPESGAARTLFDEALADMKAGRWTAACPKLERGTVLDRGTGMRHNLALCYEHTGRPASAWSLFLEVATDAAAQGQTQRAQVAKAHAAALEPKLSYIQIVVPSQARIDGLEVRSDGRVLGRTEWGAKAAVDPGTHAIEALCPERRAWRKEVSIGQESETVTVTIPLLALNTSPIESDTDGSAKQTFTTTRKLALVIGGVGVVGVAVGSWLGLRAISRNNESTDLGCVGNNCTEAGGAVRRSARSDGNMSTLGFVVGAAALAGGATLWIFGGPADSRRVAVHPGHEAALAGLTLQGAW